MNQASIHLISTTRYYKELLNQDFSRKNFLAKLPDSVYSLKNDFLFNFTYLLIFYIPITN